MSNATPPIGYEVKFQRVGVGGGADLQIRSLLDKQQFYDPLGLALDAGISSATWPLFGLVWPFAQKLADLMQAWDINGKRVLEVGCGLGLASLVVHRREGNITASDCHPLTETFLKANVLLNDLPPLHYETGNWGRVNKGLGAFDLLIASDVLYERSHPAQLAGFIEEHAAEGAEVLIVDPNRGNRSAFHKDMANMGFGVTEIIINEPLEDLSAYRGRLLHFKRS
ncbi:methyltransferase type 12 [Limnohabitans sp. MORI2]|uniref:class I SAM-dependent methyltransferase n=1 Tax=Limnohabitans sp. MORI2 TaxID=1751150 RepID=UPI0023775584|nr:methyltransferase domain-containing protein [Limnohabitans sp. MORI2]BDU58309.1 methyltransferase type 12 [Limnohabitans sp. MORI2]